MHHFFVAIHQLINQKKKISLIGFVFLFAILGYLASKITFEENITRLLPTTDKASLTSKVINQMNFSDKISIIISKEKNGNDDDLTQYANQFLDSISVSCKPYVKKIQGKIDEENIQETIDFVYQNLPLFLNSEDYKTIANKLHSDSISNTIASDYKSLIAPTGFITRDYILQDPLGISFIALKKLQQLSVGDNFDLQNGYVVTKDHSQILLFITPKLPTNETDKNTLFIKKLNSIQTNLNASFKEKANLLYFGATPVAVGNATQIKSDIQMTSIFASLCLIGILLFFYRSITIPILIFIPSLCGAIVALSILYLTKGTISAISLGISSILLGETTDYSVYVLTHLRNNKNIKLLYKDITKPLLLCGGTTAITFLCLFFIKSEALQDLAIFAALSVIVTAFFSLILIPFFYKSKAKTTVISSNIIDKLGAYNYHKNKFFIVSVLLILFACSFTFQKVNFNNDLSSLNYLSPELKKTEQKLDKLANFSSKSIYLASYGQSAENVISDNNSLFQKLEKAQSKNEILSFTSVGGIVFSKEKQNQKIKEWNSFWTPEKKAKLQHQLIQEGTKFGFKPNTFAVFYQTLHKSFLPISISEYAKVKSLFLEEFLTKKDGFYTVSTLVKIPNESRDTFVKDLENTPNLVIIDRQQTNETFLGSLKENFENLVNYSFLAVLLLLLITFKRVELAIVSVIPITISWLFTLGIMGLFGLQFNIFNIIVCTLIFGIGVDYSIFMTAALQKQYTYNANELPTYKSSILLSVITTILGIGVLIFAKHPALKSIALVAIVGIFSALIITFVIQPLVFQFIATNRAKKGIAPLQLRTFIHSIISFLYFGLGCFLLSIISLILLKIIPLKNETKMKGFRFLISKFMKSVLYTNPFVPKKVLNPFNETFSKPAIIIANHSSFLDILAVGMLSPKIIYLVSDWVYNSPIFGAAVKKAGFYPVSEGLEDGVEHLRKKVEEGYSLMVFPEGTRSETNQIKRFKKGAFFLAEEFNLPILPIVIHGTSEALPKGDYIIYDSTLTISILERIQPDNFTFGSNYTQRTKQISGFFKQMYFKLRKQNEGVDYFKKIVIDSFIYKEEEITKTIKLDWKQNAKTYFNLNSLIAPKSKILHISDDFGQLDVLLALQEPQRKIVSYNQDIAKISVAQANYLLKNRSIKYLSYLENDLNIFYDYILISGINSTLLETTFAHTNAVILVNASILKNTIVTFGFAVTYENEEIVVLNRK